ncbi:acetate/propionate family kinase [Mahella australiensis]|uniref:Acetate kinase n=1 Tax=Mahella australiensis (strain DSM 15567 / CIP 107919 / 50-1 BON) TaxID=697281 RepID=F4A046_MAHA5|nr:acetate kinase [Mahella australiensis]AEE96880.1 acetate kinase [Mahella australiensis 50-1 BON]
MNILVINAGSSSLKYQLIDMTTESVRAKGNVERIGLDGSVLKHQYNGNGKAEIKQDVQDHLEAFKLVIKAITDPEYGVIKDISKISAVGHRMVNGGERFIDPILLTDEIIETMKNEVIEFAPLHNPGALMGMEACRKLMPDTPMVVVVDTEFFKTLPRYAYMYGLPYDVYTQYKIRRYGAHGTSHKYVSLRAAKMLGKAPEEVKLITCHLGNGSSISAVSHGKAIDTSMGFTPLEGLIMGTRSGDLDPAVVTYLMEKKGMSPSEMNDYLNKESGILGISGVSSDLRDVEDAAVAGNERAQLAMDMLCYRAKKYIGSYIAALNGVDALVFTAGIGENNATVRNGICQGLENLGIKLDLEKNKVRGIEADISAEDSKVKVFVVPTNEELMIARETRSIVEGQN